MRRMGLDVLGISEMQWPEEGDFWSGDYRVIHYGSNDGNAGTGIILRRSSGMRVKSYYQLSDRILMVRLETKLKDPIVLQVYMPTSNYEDDEIEDMHDSIEEVIKTVRGGEKLIILGDWIAVVGEGQDGKTVGRYGLGRRNYRGERLIEFCVQTGLIITNAVFCNHPRRRYT
jgi:exonuclease III